MGAEAPPRPACRRRGAWDLPVERANDVLEADEGAVRQGRQQPRRGPSSARPRQSPSTRGRGQGHPEPRENARRDARPPREMHTSRRRWREGKRGRLERKETAASLYIRTPWNVNTVRDGVGPGPIFEATSIDRIDDDASQDRPGRTPSGPCSRSMEFGCTRTRPVSLRSRRPAFSLPPRRREVWHLRGGLASRRAFSLGSG